ncbi:histidine kinase [Ornithinimicrobium tianjinense]|uniref:histidine kinase n=1 Tax=Ornithinimicrobium tianjinense TaxID=1195761 RepID=A0A917BIF6_9MICO|nr:histidine kinase [Ornithinimicrobium tianjinense]
MRETLSRSTLSPADVDWLHRLVGDWQMVADLSFADLTLWLPVPVEETDGPEMSWFLAAHARPSTGPNFYHDDVIGRQPDPGRLTWLTQVQQTGHSVTPDGTGYVREQYVPVVRRGRTIAVLIRHTDLQNMRQQGGLEVNYLQISQQLFSMISEGAFPVEGAATGVGRGTPRVGDGVIRLTADGVIDYASPNAVSALRRLGHTGQVNGADLSEIVTARLVEGTTVDETVPLVLTGRAPWGTELETGGINLTLRAVPLLRGGARVGALLLLRDVSEIRRRERELLSKDATIREIHHRVKNNLQTVAALLRLQSRRLDDPTARAALAEAGRRLATVALVHDTLSHALTEQVDFDGIALRILRATVEVAATRTVVATELAGSFGQLAAEDATHVAMILAELVQNAVEHGFEEGPPQADAESVQPLVRIEAERRSEGSPQELEVVVRDNGAGLPEGTTSPDRSGLGVQIVEALISDLRGHITWETAEPHGTVVRFTVRLRCPG